MKGTSLIFTGVIFVIALLFLAFWLPAPAVRRIETNQSEPTEGSGANVLAGNDVLAGNAGGQPHTVTNDEKVSESPAVTQENPPVTEDSAQKTETPAPQTSNAPIASDPAPAPSKAVAESNDSAIDHEKLAFPEWPKPQLALIVTGEQLGYFEPCGCTANQLGGMNRRAALAQQMQDLGWTVRGLDAGSLSRRSTRQAQIKVETTLNALRDLNYLAIGLGPEELRLDPSYLISQHITDGENPLFFLSANLVFYGAPDLGTPLPYRIVEIDGLKTGITSVLGDGLRRSVIPDRPEGSDAGQPDIAWSEPVEALKTVMQKFDEENVQFRILLSQAPLEESRKFAEQFPSLQLIVTTQGFGEGEKQPELIGNVRMLQVGEKGKHAGVVGIYPEDTDNPIRFELITLSEKHFGESEKMIAHMKAYQERLKDEQIVLAESEVGHPSGATFVGAARCGECHTKAFSVWKDTAHAHAFESLDPTNGRTGHERLNGVSRTFDPECLSCHVTGWDPQEFLRFRSGFLNKELARDTTEERLQDLLAGNQCENCHGPGSRHVELVEAGKIEESRQDVRVTLEQARDQDCIKCHDGDNSPGFKFEKYWDAVKHPGMD